MATRCFARLLSEGVAENLEAKRPFKMRNSRRCGVATVISSPDRWRIESGSLDVGLKRDCCSGVKALLRSRLWNSNIAKQGEQVATTDSYFQTPVLPA
jgi:hypothetical protein